MNLLKKLNFGLYTFVGDGGSAEKDEPEKIYTIVLDNGTIQQTLKIPVAFLDTKKERIQIENGLWVRFVYPSADPVSANKSKDEIIEIYIKLAPNIETPSMSEQTFGFIKKLMEIKPKNKRPLFIGNIGVFDVYEEDDPEDEFTITTYFTHDEKGILVSFRDDGYQVNALRRTAGVLELSYFFSVSLRFQQLQVDAEVVKLISGWLQK